MKKSSIKTAGVSIITCTKRAHCIHRVFENYRQQLGVAKELIIILNNDQLDLNKYRKMAQNDPQISIYRLPQKRSLGSCLNYGVQKSKYDLIAKFDDDDYYGPYYLKQAVQAFELTKADVIGKRTYFMYFEGRKRLVLRFPNCEKKYVSLISGATIMAKKSIFQTVPFANKSLGEDVQFFADCKAKGYRIFSTDRHHYVAIRNKDRFQHTWKATEKQLISKGFIVFLTDQYKRYAQHI